MAEFRDSENNNTLGLAAFPNGKEYYALILQQSIGSNQSVEDVQAMMDSAFEDHLTELQTIMFTDMEGVEPLVNLSLIHIFTAIGIIGLRSLWILRPGELSLHMIFLVYPLTWTLTSAAFLFYYYSGAYRRRILKLKPQ